MRKILMLITSVRVKIQLNLQERSLDKGKSLGPIKKINRGK